MKRERRDTGNPIREEPQEILNEVQLLTLRRMAEFGWDLKFVRRPLFQNAVPVLHHSDNDQLVILDDEGAFIVQPEIRVRA
jgi:hypothetical protein